jgi:DNA-directed RNA polymerase specialized sigma24 family protein
MGLESLSPRQREVWLLHFDGFSRRAIAVRLGIGEQSVKTHLAIAREKLRRGMDDYDYRSS